MRATGLYQCPECSRVITFRNSETRLNVCTCGTVVSRLESDDLVKRYHYLVPECTDLVQVGSTGTYEGKRFEVIGRFRMWLEDSAYNYWTVLFEDTSLAFLAEGYGLYALLQRTTLLPLRKAELSELKVSNTIHLKFGCDEFRLQKKDICKTLEIEGEVWMPESKDRIPVFDLATMQGDRITVFEFLPDYLVGYDVKYLGFEQLQLKNLNEAPLKGKEFRCPECKHVLRVKTYPYAQSCGCVECGTRFSLVNTSTFEAYGKDKKNDNKLHIPLGAVGKIRNIEYEVIGYALKKDPEGYLWKEYTLHNKQEGYAFLSEFKGNWMYVREQGNTPVMYNLQSYDFTYGDRLFKLYNRYGISVVDVAGEFPYNIFDTAETNSAEFICPPEVWIYERTGDSVCWFLGEHISGTEVEKAYPYVLPGKQGIGMVEPVTSNPRTMKLVACFSILFMIAVHFAINSMHNPKIIVSTAYNLADSAATSSFVTEPFELKKWRSNLEFEITAAVDNSWFDMTASLVNAKTNEEYSLEQGVEYYHGREDGEDWSEGSRTEYAYLSSIPAGTYFLRMEGSQDVSSGNRIGSFFVTITNDVSMDRNLLLFLIPLFIWPAFKLYRMDQLEKNRWYNSNFSPYTYNDD